MAARKGGECAALFVYFTAISVPARTRRPGRLSAAAASTCISARAAPCAAPPPPPSPSQASCSSFSSSSSSSSSPLSSSPSPPPAIRSPCPASVPSPSTASAAATAVRRRRAAARATGSRRARRRRVMRGGEARRCASSLYVHSFYMQQMEMEMEIERACRLRDTACVSAVRLHAPCCGATGRDMRRNKAHVSRLQHARVAPQHSACRAATQRVSRPCTRPRAPRRLPENAASKTGRTDASSSSESSSKNGPPAFDAAMRPEPMRTGPAAPLKIE